MWEKLFLQYGIEFLNDTDSGDPLFEMDSLESVLKKESKENDTTRVFALGAYSYGYYGGSFDIRADYFLIDNAGNYASLEERNLLRYIADEIDEPYFLNWLFENGYISDEEYKRLQWDLSY